MVKYGTAALDATFGALADPTRREILHRLTTGALAVGELAARFDMSWPAVTKHLKVLERAKLVRREKDGRVHKMHLEAEPMRDAQAWIEEYRAHWKQQLDVLADFLERTTPESERGGAT